MKTLFTLALFLILNHLSFGQASPVSEYLFTNGSLLNTENTTSSLTSTGSNLTSVPDRDGFPDNAISLNGDVLQEQNGVTRTNFSVSFWMKTSTNDANPRYIIDQWGGNPGGKGAIGYRVYMENGELHAVGRFYVFNQNTHFVSGDITTAGGAIADGQWHHVVLTMSAWSRSTLNGNFPNVSHRLYVDNVMKQLTTVEIGTGGGTGRTVEAVPLSVGNIQDQSATANYEDEIDDIRFYTSKLSDAEVATIFAQRTSKARIHVKNDATGNNDGSSWTDAFTDLKAATDNATSAGDEIWVAQGTYKPDASDRTVFLTLKKGVKLYGGFDGTETEVNERDWINNPTILSGDLSDNDDEVVTYSNTLRGDNSYRIIYVEGSDVIIDGVTITSGQANNTANNDYNRGAAIYKNSSAENLTLRNSIISKNVSNREGNLHLPFDGENNDLIIENCIFHHNFARYGVGFTATVSNGATLNAKVYNSLFHSNVAGDISTGDGFSGSSIFFGANEGRIDLAVINSTFTENEDLGTNTSNDKGTILIRRLNDDGSSVAHATFHNTIFYNNLLSPGLVNAQAVGFMNRPANKLNSLTFTHNISSHTNIDSKASTSIVSNNIDQDPMFTDAGSQDFTLATGSPAIDAGSNDQLPDDLLGDILGNKRIHNTTVDMGVYENGSTPRNTVAPTAIAQNITVQLESNGEVTVDASQVNNGSTDDDTADNELIFSLDKATFTCEDLGANTVTLTVKDASLNKSTAEAIITVISNINDETVSIADDSFCSEAGTTVSTAGSVSGINYFLRNSADNSVIEGPISGTGSALNFNTGSISENATFNVYAEVPPVNEISGGLDFDGTNDRIATTYTVSTTKTFTLEAWVFPRGTSWGRLFSNMNYSSLGSTAGDFIVDTFGSPDNGRNVRFILDGETSDIQLYANQALTLNEWNHIAVTFDNGVAKILVNGVEVASDNNPAVTRILGSSRPTHFGVHGGASPVRYFNGKMDEVRIWNVAKTSTEISASMNKCLSGTENGLSAYFNFEDAEGTTLTELVAGNNGTLVNMDETSGWTEGPELLCGAGCGFQMSNEVTLEVGDAIAPTAVTKDITVGLNPNGEASISADDINDGSSDNCTADAELDLSIDKELFFSPHLGTNTVTLTVADASGNTATADATVTVVDNLPPTAITQNLTIQLDANGDASITSTEINNGSKDNSTANGDLVLSLSKSTFSCADVGSNTITLTVEDLSGNQSTATATVTVTETIAPVAVAQDITVSLDADGLAAIVAADIDNGSTDNCGIDQITLDVTNFTCDDLGTNPVTLTVSDASGNTSTTTATVTVEDTSSPTVITQDITIELDASGAATITTADIDNGSLDNCSVDNMSIDLSTFSCSDLGTNTVTLSTSDASGNTASASATVTVVDVTAPVVATQNIDIRLDAAGQATITTADVDNGSSDNCSLTLTLDKSAFTTSDLGQNTVTLTGTDPSGNTATASAVVNVSPFQQTQTITFGTIPDQQYGVGVVLGATASSGLGVSYTVIEGPASLTFDQAFFSGIGVVTIEATQNGNDSFLPAEAVRQTFTVSPAVLTATANNQQITYGDAIPDLTGSITGFVNSEDASVLISAPVGSTTATASSDAGVYPITVSGGSADNYTFNYVGAELTIVKATATIALSDLVQEVDGTAKTPTVVTTPAGLSASITYNGETAAPTSVGIYQVEVTIDDVNYEGTTNGVFELIEPVLSHIQEVTFEVYPNPTADVVFVQSPQSEPAYILDLEGRTVLKSMTNREIDVTSLSPGIYMVLSGNMSERLIKR